jgi:hypothetical protein
MRLAEPQCATESRQVKVTKVLRPVQYWVLGELVAGGVARAVPWAGVNGDYSDGWAPAAAIRNFLSLAQSSVAISAN